MKERIKTILEAINEGAYEREEAISSDFQWMGLAKETTEIISRGKRERGKVY